MDEKTLRILEFSKILDRLADYTAFAVSAEKARALRPTTDLEEARRRQAVTGEAVQILIVRPDLSIGGARDIRAAVDMAHHGGVLEPQELLDIKYTMISGRNIRRLFERLEDGYPRLTDIAMQLPPASGLIDAISTAISDRGDILDTASEKLANIRRELHIVRDRLLSKLQGMVSDPKTAAILQEALVTQRDGRYVLPLRAEFKGRMRAIVHDQSSSGATLFVEPLAVVEQNNQYRELQLAERDEERRILADLSSQVATQTREIQSLVDVLAEIDLAFACGKYAEDLRATQPILLPLEKDEPVTGRKQEARPARHPGSVIQLVQARHPLLDPQTVVAVDVELDRETYALVITGPNTGGKTVTLKTVGLLALMAQSGLHIPVHSGSQISVFKGIFADIGDEQSIEQSLSTFSSHITNIIRILERADRRSLVILDELGAGTDPQEGAALARALLSHLLERGITTLVTTHHPELKAFAHTTPGVVNASVEFDLETLQPTFHLTIGLPGRSNALAIAQRLGLPESIIETARSEISPEDLRAEDLLDEIHRQRDLAREARTQADSTRREAESLRTELAERLENIEDERREILEGARLEAKSRLEELEKEVRDLRREMARARQPLEAMKAVERQVEQLEEQVEKPETRQQPRMGPAAERMQTEERRALRLGDKVRVRSLNTQGVVTGLDEEEAEVQVGMLRVRAGLSDLQLVKGGSESTDRISKTRAPARRDAGPSERRAEFMPQSPGMQLDLRGQRADEALDALDRYLDSAYLAGLPFVRIIHGKGTGRLRDVVRQALGVNPHVRSYEPGSQQEGGDGVTVAKLKTS
jgi:DNA mismatch repair protein MutS2